MPISLDFKDRVIVVCGVARGGIGGATARNLAGLGAVVVGIDKAQELVDATKADIEALKGLVDVASCPQGSPSAPAKAQT